MLHRKLAVKFSLREANTLFLLLIQTRNGLNVEVLKFATPRIFINLMTN